MPVTRPRARSSTSSAWWLALGLANLTNLFDPEVIVLGGGLVEEADLLLEPIRRLYEGLLYASTHRPRPHLVPAVLGERRRCDGRRTHRVERAQLGALTARTLAAWISLQAASRPSNWPVVDSLPGSRSL